MSLPSLQVNNFIQPKAKCIKKNKNVLIDLISKAYIILDLILGVNRISLISSSKTLLIFMFCYYAFTNALQFYGCFCNITISSDYYTILDTITFFIYTTLGGLLHTRLCKFYSELNKFDEDIGFNAKLSRGAQYNICLLFLSFGLTMILFCAMPGGESKTLLFYICTPLAIMLHGLELHYYGHLFSLVIPRLKLMINYFKLSYPNPHQERDNGCSSQEFKNFKKQEHKYSNIDLQMLTTFYEKIIIIYDDLYSAIKWQLFTLLVATFIYILFMSFGVMKILISGMSTSAGSVCIFFLNLAIKLAHILAPCVFADQVHSEASALREILACRLYDNTLDKSSRGSARTLLALIETRDLSFSLFHMINVDMSLVFKFLGLLLTYLVILLQFDKVVNT